MSVLKKGQIHHTKRGERGDFLEVIFFSASSAASFFQ